MPAGFIVACQKLTINVSKQASIAFKVMSSLLPLSTFNNIIIISHDFVFSMNMIIHTYMRMKLTSSCQVPNMQQVFGKKRHVMEIEGSCTFLYIYIYIYIYIDR